MLGGAMMAWFDSKLLQERRTTVSEALPPTTHQSFSRFPMNQRVNPVSRTDRSLADEAPSCLRIFTGKNA